MDGQGASPLIVRLLEPKDVFGVYSAMTHPKIYSSIYWMEFTNNFSIAQDWVKKGIEGAQTGSEFFFTLTDVKGDYIGSINFHKRAGETYELGYWIMPEYRNFGFATNGVATAIGELRGLTKANELIATVSPLNRHSKRVLENNGFMNAGHTQVVSPDGSVRSSELFKLPLVDL